MCKIMQLRHLLFTFLSLGGTLYADDRPCRTELIQFYGNDLVGWIQLTLLGAPPTPMRDQARGKRLFEGHCGRCHGMQGGGGTGANLRRAKLQRAPDDASLFDLIRDGIPESGMPYTWAMNDNEVRDVVAYVRALGRVAPEPLPGDPARGKLVYHKADCGTCHIIAGKGGSLGPELTE